MAKRAAKRVKVAVATGTRAEYGILRPVLRAIAAHPMLELQVVATGMHLLKEFGNTIAEVRADEFGVAAEVVMYRGGDHPADSLARGTAGLAKAFRELEPEVVVVLGDRLEMLAAAGAALCEHQLIAHIHGGETAPGQFDEQIRHAITKMAHVHFAATATAAARIRQMGEDPRSVHVVGAPALDAAVANRKTLPARRHGGIRPVLIYHPTSPDDAVEYRRAAMLVRGLRKQFADIGVVGPNNDPGHAGILRAYQELLRPEELAMSIPQEVFWTVLWDAGLLVGNSSSGIIEAATFHTAVINVGGRQGARERSGNVIDVDFSPAALQEAIRRALSDGFRKTLHGMRNVYGDGKSSPRIARVLAEVGSRHAVPLKGFADYSSQAR